MSNSHCELNDEMHRLTYQGPATKNPDYIGVFCYLNFLKVQSLLGI